MFFLINSRKIVLLQSYALLFRTTGASFPYVLCFFSLLFLNPVHSVVIWLVFFFGGRRITLPSLVCFCFFFVLRILRGVFMSERRHLTYFAPPRALRAKIPHQCILSCNTRLCMQFNPMKRLSAKEALGHHYVLQFHNPEESVKSRGEQLSLVLWHVSLPTFLNRTCTSWVGPLILNFYECKSQHCTVPFRTCRWHGNCSVEDVGLPKGEEQFHCWRCDGPPCGCIRDVSEFNKKVRIPQQVQMSCEKAPAFFISFIPSIWHCQSSSLLLFRPRQNGFHLTVFCSFSICLSCGSILSRPCSDRRAFRHSLDEHTNTKARNTRLRKPRKLSWR